MSAATAAAETLHVPVMGAEVVQNLSPRADGSYVDGTFGAGGYSRMLLDAGAGHVFGIDRDATAIAGGEHLVEAYPSRLVLLEGQFGEMSRLLEAAGVDAVDGVALDLGVSSMQIDQADRGFSFMRDGPLDMRMGRDGPSAADLVNHVDEFTLADWFWRYGEERHSRRIARAIIAARAIEPLTRTLQLAEIVARAMPRMIRTIIQQRARSRGCDRGAGAGCGRPRCASRSTGSRVSTRSAGTRSRTRCARPRR